MMGKKSRWINSFSFLAGVAVMNVAGSGVMASYGVGAFWDDWQIAFPSISYDRYFCYLLLERLKVAAVVVLLTRAFPRRIAAGFCAAGFCFLTGAFLTLAVLDTGVYGLFASAAAMFPQWLCYIASFLLYASENQNVGAYHHVAGRAGVFWAKCGARYLAAIVIFLCGCLLEAYLSPLIVKKL